MQAKGEIETSPVPLSELKPGESGVVHAYLSHSSTHYRLRELGLVRGTRISVKRYAPFGDPMELVVRRYHLSIRKKDASRILVIREQGEEAG